MIFYVLVLSTNQTYMSQRKPLLSNFDFIPVFELLKNQIISC
jgi:hypothetical protein